MSKQTFGFILYSVFIVACGLCLFATIIWAVVGEPLWLGPYTFAGIPVFLLLAKAVERFGPQEG